MLLGPGHRVFVQSAHRAVSFGAVAFLIVHIVTEILAQRSRALDAFIPFLSPFRTFYIGLGTIASDLIILIVITGIFRKRFTANGNAWKWRAIHYASYVSFAFGVWHGLLGGRPGKPYVDWSYGFLVALVALGLVVRILSNSLRPLSSAPVPAAGGISGSAPVRAASMFAQLGIARAAASGGGATGPMLAASRTSRIQNGPAPALGSWNTGHGPAVAAVPVVATGPMRRGSGPMPRAGSGPMPGAASGPMPRAGSGPMPRAGSGPMPRAGSGPMPRAGSGPMPGAASGPMPRPVSGPMPRPASGPTPRARSGPMPRAAFGPMPRPVPGSMPRPGMGPMPRAASGPMPHPGAGPHSRGAWDARGGAWDGVGRRGGEGVRESGWDPDVARGADPGRRYREPGPGMPGHRARWPHETDRDQYGWDGRA
jgi:hypothetical protein